jgi:N-dimethylarginine dimethylaminohydrolase
VSDRGIEDETSVLRDVLVGPPEHFRWLPTSAISKAALAGDRQLAEGDAQAAHAEMVAAYQAAGVTVHRLPADPALPYQVFSRDSSIWAADGPIVTQLHQWWRRGEYAPVLDFYADAGIPLAHKVTAAAFEGGDLVLAAPRVALIGYCDERTQEPAARQVAGWLEELGWEVRLQPFDPHFVHIDVLTCVVAPGLAVICEEAAPPGLAGWLREKDLELLEVSYRDAFGLGANVMSLGEDRVLSTAGAVTLNERLRSMGFTVYDPDLWPFTMGGGGPHCLAQPLRRG